MTVVTRVYIGLGSNIGDRCHNLERAARELVRLGRELKTSSLYETEPVGVEDQPWFLNAVASLETDLWPRQLVRKLKQIEDRLGRVPGRRFGPRVIDLDLLLYGDLEIDVPTLAVPHPRLHLRRFVLEPLAELDPELRHPSLGFGPKEMLERLEGESDRRVRRAGPFPPLD